MLAKDQVANLIRLLRKRIPRAACEVDAPSQPNGGWFIDVAVEDRTFVIEFRPDLGFGMSSTPTEGLGEGADEFFEAASEVVERMAELLHTKSRTAPQRVRLLQELRELRALSQVVLASKLGVRQPTLSKMERREDVNMSTLRRYVQALGGELHVTARFPDGAVEIGPETTRSKRRASR